MNDRDMKEIMHMYDKIDLCPVTISKRQEIKSLKGLHTLIRKNDYPFSS